MKNLIRVGAFLLCVILLACTVAAISIEDYSDFDRIKEIPNLIEPLDKLTQLGIMDGMSGAFQPDALLSREQFAKIISYCLILRDGSDSLVASEAPFDDVARDRWSAGAIAYVKRHGIINGYGNGKFGPNDKLTYAQMIKIVVCTMGLNEPAIAAGGYPDGYISVAKDMGILSNITYEKNVEVCRADACKMVYNYLKLKNFYS